MIDILLKWNESNEAFGLELPNGWFGRPFDNHHNLTWYADRPNKLIIELDEQLYLIYTKPLEIIEASDDLVIKNFQQLIFDRQEYASMKTRLQEFNGGSVTFVSYNI